MSVPINPEKVALRRAAEIVGGQAALAELLGCDDRRIVWAWSQPDRRVPAEKCPLIEKATSGQVRCEELRPDIAWDVLRMQAGEAPWDGKTDRRNKANRGPTPAAA